MTMSEPPPYYPLPDYHPRSWLTDVIAHEPGGLVALAQRVAIDPTRLEQITRGHMAYEAEAHALARTLDVAITLLFKIPKKPSRLRTVATVGLYGLGAVVLVLFIAALIALRFYVPSILTRIHQPVPSTANPQPTNHQKSNGPHLPSLPVATG